ncbi:MAG: biotin--[acetyl-CoA-carboxylase] ligase [Deltaproteobacteria bacterium]|nr:MAG: biotin--[acetyl-CoA-carboxylase] ligase [Deltaproteobacteria bacterium]
MQPGQLMMDSHYFDEIDSTNELAKSWDLKKVFTLLSTKRQTQGHGQRGRAWSAPQGNLSFSLIWKEPTIPLSDRARISLVTGVSLVLTLSEYTPGMLSLKWPNDLFLNGKKVSGILVEGFQDRVIIGIGINLNSQLEDLPIELQKNSETFFHVLNKKLSEEEVLEKLTINLIGHLSSLSQGHWDDLMKDYSKYSCLINKKVQLEDGRRGVVAGFGHEGELIFQDESKSSPESIVSGSVFLEK